jgi:stearoyl-CoA desaturase (delta-9 desaturase)
MIEGVLGLSFWGIVGATLLMTHITIAAVTIYLHRHQAHRALELHPAVAHFFRAWLWLTTGMETKAWTAIHRKHHARCETAEDPHSPQVLGLRKVLWEGAELYRAEAKNKETMEKYGFGTPDDWIERHLYTPYSRHGILLMLAIDIALFGPIGITVWAVQMLWIPVWAAGVVNGVGHYWGYRNYETTDAATNISPWGILIGGEELHNNHHAFPSSAKLSSKAWEFDIGWFYIRTLELLGLAKVKKIAPKPYIVPGKESVDSDTVKAILVNRLHVLASYGRTVIGPAVREEWDKADSAWRIVLKGARRLMVRDEGLIDDRAKGRLAVLFSGSQSLSMVYEYKQRLQDLWARSHTGSDMVVALQEWCRQAEATGNKYLSDFAATLRGYTLSSAERH